MCMGMVAGDGLTVCRRISGGRELTFRRCRAALWSRAPGRCCDRRDRSPAAPGGMEPGTVRTVRAAGRAALGAEPLRSAPGAGHDPPDSFEEVADAKSKGLPVRIVDKYIIGPAPFLFKR